MWLNMQASRMPRPDLFRVRPPASSHQPSRLSFNFPSREMLSALALAAYVVAAGALTAVDLDKDVTFSSGWTKETNLCGGTDYVTSTEGSSMSLSWFGMFIYVCGALRAIRY